MVTHPTEPYGYLKERRDWLADAFVHGSEDPPAAQQLIAGFNEAHYLGILLGRLSKMDLDPEVDQHLSAARQVLREMEGAELWASRMYSLYGLVALLARDGSAESMNVLREVVGKLRPFGAADTVKNPSLNVHSVLQCVGEGPHVTALRQDLAEEELSRRMETESAQLAERLALPIKDRIVFHATIMIGDGEPAAWFDPNLGSTQLSIDLDPTKKPDWRLEVRGPKGKGILSCWAGETLQNDFRVSVPASLFDLPAWLVSAQKELDARLSVDDAKIRFGRYKKPAPILKDWLAGRRRVD